MTNSQRIDAPHQDPKVLIRRCLAVAALSILMTHSTLAKEFHVYYLGGQSNMDGYGSVSELPKDLRDPIPGVWIFHGNMAADGKAPDGRGKWSPLQPGHGRSFSSDGKENQYSDRFGAELTFALRLKELYPDRNIALIKYSRGGTSIDPTAAAAKTFGCWDTEWSGGEGPGKGINQFDHYQATLTHARSDTDIDDDGESDRLIPSGIVWMQGESDAMAESVAQRYEQNLTKLMQRIRVEFSNQSVPIVIGQITSWKVWKHADLVRAAQASFVRNDGNAALVTTTDRYGHSDQWHYDTAGYIDLGKQFADAIANAKK